MRVRRYFPILLIVVVLLVTGCSHEKPYVAGLTAEKPEAVGDWGIPEHLITEGTGNVVRVVKGTSLGAEQALELATSGGSVQEYFQEIPADGLFQVNYRMQFLSTQGRGRVKLSALDSNKRLVASVGWVYTGEIPASGPNTKWFDMHYKDNYHGDWLKLEEAGLPILTKNLPLIDLSRIASYRLSVEVGNGQHVLVTHCQLASLPVQVIQVSPKQSSFSVLQGDLVTLEAEVENKSSNSVSATSLELVEPYGYGLTVAKDRVVSIPALEPGEKRLISWQIKADRPDGVNMGKPWPLTFAVDGKPLPGLVTVAVKDPRPGKIFYVLTEDLEPMDAAGYPIAWGKGAGWLEPEELRVQMVEKAERANAIAEQYGAKWTHYIAWPVVKAAEWASGQSSTGEWAKTVGLIKESVREQSAKGHEYAVHLHSDYDPYLPGNVLSYNPDVDGIWANHLKHGWSHSVLEEGDFSDYTSRAGMLLSYQSTLDELSVRSPNGQIVTSRVGSFDIGDTSASQGISTRVYHKVGLFGSSDADGNRDGVTAGDYGKEIYFAKPDDINSKATELTNIGLVEFRPTPREFISYSEQSAAVMNQKADDGVNFFAPGGNVAPGVHGIIGFTHLMFVMGSGDWTTLQGGQFQELDNHLRYLKEKFVDKGILEFSTASGLVKEYLDYYTPELTAVYGPRSTTGWGESEYPIVLLGRDILVDAEHSHKVSMKYPLYLRGSAYRISILKNGSPIYSTWGLPTPYNDINFVVDDREAIYTMKVYQNETILDVLSAVRRIKAKLVGAAL